MKEVFYIVVTKSTVGGPALSRCPKQSGRDSLEECKNKMCVPPPPPMQSNRLERCIGFEQCTSLEELYLSHNGIKEIEVCDIAAQLLDVRSQQE